MPQLDQAIIFPQIFWFFVFFIIFYTILLHILLPNMIISLKSRKKLIQLHNLKTKNISINFNNIQSSFFKDLNLNLQNLQNSFFFDLPYIQTFLNQKMFNNFDKKLVISIFNNILYCNKHVLELIKVYPLNLNLKFKKN